MRVAPNAWPGLFKTSWLRRGVVKRDDRMRDRIPAFVRSNSPLHRRAGVECDSDLSFMRDFKVKLSLDGVPFQERLKEEVSRRKPAKLTGSVVRGTAFPFESE